ncbi:hypothetical protein CF319_g6103 [Tilletia indica]|nr:hypothetical protein CF319_g6103 [Tilletia indica]
MHHQGRRAGPGPAAGAAGSSSNNSSAGIGGGSYGPVGGGGGAGMPSSASAANLSARQKAALASAYEELGKELHASSALKTVGNYTLGRPIAEGTFGKVSLATHRLTNTRVAIKQIPKTHSSHAAAALTREIHHHRKLHHPHVIQLYEVLATESSIWMVSELCAGGELYDYLVERGTLPDAEARRLFGQLCLAVAYIHERGIVHRDLKLENVLLDEMCNVKLGDFGFTREFERRKLMDTFCGTTGYAAPEMLAGKKYFGQEVDIWSLGIILYALLTGALPFDDDDEDIMRLKILQGDFDIPEDLSDDARDLISSILKQNPVERPGIRAILSHPWFTRPRIPSLPTHPSFGTSGPESADHHHPPSSYRHPHPPSSAPPSDGGSEVIRERESESRERERSRAASRTGGGPVSDLPPTTEADDESNNSVSNSGEEDAERTFRNEDSAGDETQINEKESDEPVVGVHITEGDGAQTDSATTTLIADSLTASSSSSSSSFPSAPVGLHETTGSTLSQMSDLSFVSAVSESESASAPASSNEESTSPGSESTSPTTEEDEQSEEGAERTHAGALVKAPGEIAQDTAKPSSDDIDRQRLKTLRNESQTTIRRKDSMGSGSDQSRRASGPTSIGANVPAPLPTHHESPSSSIDDPQDTTARSNSGPPQVSSTATTAASAITQSAAASTSAPALTAGGAEGSSNVPKVHSQNSSRSLAAGPGAAGHFRTPSRTKRRSASSIALSVEGILPPQSASSTRYVDYVSLLTQLHPVLFSTLVEQRLLFALSMVGVEVGQIVHSVTTDACDASGALWWLLKKKAEEKEREKESEAIAAGLSSPLSKEAEAISGIGALGPSASAPTGVQRPVSPPLPPTPQSASAVPPPIPPKDPARQRTESDHARAAAVAALVSIGSNEGLPKSAQDSFREHLSRLPGSSGSAAMAALRQLERDRSLAAVSGSSAAAAGAGSIPGSQSDPILGLNRAASLGSNTSSEAVAAARAAAAAAAAVGRTSLSLGEGTASASLTPGTASHNPTSPLRQQVIIETPTQTTSSSPSSTSAALATAALNLTPTKGTRPKRADRQRTNSLSIRTFANALSGRGGDTSGTGNSSGNQDGESNHPERAKSPVSALFSRRGAGSLISKAGGGRAKEIERSNTTGGNGAGSGGPSATLGPKADPFKPDAPASILSKGSGTPVSPVPTVRTTTSAGATSTAVTGLSPKKSVTSMKQGQLRASLSQDTFSTVQSQGESGEKKKRDKPRRPKSSFLSTVRTWLNADERHAKKRKQKQSQTAALSLAHGFGSPGSSALRGNGNLNGAGSASHSRNNSASLSGSVARNNGSIRARQNPYPPISPTVRRSLVGPMPTGSGSNRGSMSRRSSTGSTVLPGIAATVMPTSASAGTGIVANAVDGLNRPTNPRRQSAGSITPTGTAYGDYAHEVSGVFAPPARGSRPSSMHSFSQQQLHPRRLPAKTGSVGSASSFRRPHDSVMTRSGSNPGSFNGGSFNGNSLKSLHSRRPSTDGGTVVRRHKSGYGLALGVNGSHQRPHHHRTGSGHSRASSPGPSMLSEIARGDGDDGEGVAPPVPSHGPSRTRGLHSNRSSTHEGDLLTVPSYSVEEPSEVLKSANGSLIGSVKGTAQQENQSGHYSTMFVAHKSRSPYKPPSANHALQGAIHRAAAASHGHGHGHGLNPSQHSTDLRSVPLCTWHRSWGRPPPGWTGPVDDSPAPPKPVSVIQRSVRDVFARRKKSGYADADDDEDWVDEDDEPAYVGGLGQLDSSRSNGVWVTSSSGLRSNVSPSHSGMGFGSMAGSHMSTYGSGASSGLPQSSSSALHPALSSPIPGRGYRPYDGFMPRGGGGAGNELGSASAQRGAYPSFLSRHTASSSSNTPFSTSASGSGGLRGLFAPPSLGSDVYPRTTVISESSGLPAVSPTSQSVANPIGADQAAEGGSDATGSGSVTSPGTAGAAEPSGTATGSGVGADGLVTPTAGPGPTPGMSGVNPRRAAAAAASAFVSIEEGEEEED